MGKERTFVKEMKKEEIRLWIMQEGEMFFVYFYHNNFPIPIDKKLVKSLAQAEQVCTDYLYPEQKEMEELKDFAV